MDIVIRKERPEDYWNTEYMTQKAFWNLHVPGCSEHLLVHKLRTDAAYIPELSRVAEKDGKIVGTIMYSRSKVVDKNMVYEVLTFGPLCVEPSFQNTGIGGLLLETTMQLARTAGHKAIIIFGEPGYYPKHGFVPCDPFGITTSNGENFDAFMGIELIPGGLDGIRGKFYTAEVFENLTEEGVNEFNKKFPSMTKLRLSGQWGSSD